MNYNFEWDPNKAKSNIVKHKISFEDATSVFRDENAISIFDLFFVPLKSICSRKCAMPRFGGVSSLDPALIHTPTEIDRTCSICSERTVIPLSRTVFL